jgi:hypothetical protein
MGSWAIFGQCAVSAGRYDSPGNEEAVSYRSPGRLGGFESNQSSRRYGGPSPWFAKSRPADLTVRTFVRTIVQSHAKRRIAPRV